MLIDRGNSFTYNSSTGADSQTLAGALTYSTNLIDLAGAAKDVGPGNPTFVWIQITATVTTGGATTGVTFALEVDSATNFPSAATLWSVTMSLANAVAGRQIYMPITKGAERYARIALTAEGGNAGAGAFEAGIVLLPQQGFVHTF